MSNPNREIDKTHLSANNADERVIRHRDLIAHAFRWAHVARYLAQNQRYKEAIVLECGCGKELPLAKMLYSNRLIPRKYVGADINKLQIPEMLLGKKIPVSVWSETDFCALDPVDVGILDGSWGGVDISKINLKPGDVDMQGVYYAADGGMYTLPNTFVSLEVLEHMHPEHARRVLVKALELTSNDCHYFISTPCWDRVNAAGNHISEITVEALGGLLEDLGYRIEGFWGTFASQKDYRPVMEQRYPGITAVFDKLSEYYDSTVVSNILAPLFSLESRNALWHLTRKRGDDASQQRLFSALEQASTPWTSHMDWRRLNG